MQSHSYYSIWIGVGSLSQLVESQLLQYMDWCGKFVLVCRVTVTTVYGLVWEVCPSQLSHNYYSIGIDVGSLSQYVESQLLQYMDWCGKFVIVCRVTVTTIYGLVWEVCHTMQSHSCYSIQIGVGSLSQYVESQLLQYMDWCGKFVLVCRVTVTTVYGLVWEDCHNMQSHVCSYYSVQISVGRLPQYVESRLQLLLYINSTCTTAHNVIVRYQLQKELQATNAGPQILQIMHISACSIGL